jgi:hypothetical protein
MLPVQPKTARGLLTFSAGSVAAPADSTKAAENYLERVRAYIPVEVLAFFIFVNSLAGALFAPGKTTAQVGGDPAPGEAAARMITADGWVALAALAIGVLGTALYARTAARTGKTKVWGVQTALAVLAFLIWTYAMGAKAYAVLGIEVIPAVAGLLLATFTLFSGFIVPAK